MKWIQTHYLSLMSLTGMIILLVSTFLSCDAYAQTTVEFKLLPPGHDGRVQGVGRARYYLLDEYLELNKFDQELLALRLDIKDQEDLIKKLELQVVDKDTSIATLEDDVKVITGRIDRCDSDLKECEDTVIDLAGSAIWPWVVAGVGAALGIAGWTAYAVERSKRK